ncbi:hypothetical protein JCM11251_003591 [Rhodosporidiobolus azoricus]
MSRPPSSRASHGRSPSVEGDYRRVSTHSFGISYAYGAPASPSQMNGASSSRKQVSPGRARSVVSGSSARGGGDGRGEIAEEDEEEEEEEPAVDAGRPVEPASVRYGRIAQRKKDTGQAYLPATGNTSVNIANAFKAATSGFGGVVTGGRREDFAPLNGAGEGAADEEQERQEDAARKEPQSAGKKRKKNVPKDPTFRHRAGETSSSEESEYDQTNGKQKKRTKVMSEEDDLADDPTAANKPRRKSAKPADPSYNPKRDPSFHIGQTSSDDDGPHKTHRRRKSKGKGRASVGSTSASQAIPRGIRDGEVWYGKKRKGRKGSRKSNGDGEAQEGEEDEDEDEEQQDFGGMDANEFSYQDGDDDSRFEQDDRDATPPAAAFYLRPRSPATAENVAASTSASSQQPSTCNGFTFAASPFRFGGSHSLPVDPAFHAFDRSLGGEGDSVSLEDSAIRGSSYDFSEEEAIVRILEEKKAATQQTDDEPLNQPNPPSSSAFTSAHQIRQTQEEQARQKQQKQQQQVPPTPGPSQQRQAALAATPALQHLRQQQPSAAPSPAGSLTATPVPYTGAYPQTPGPAAGNGVGSSSPVSAFRRRAGKGVPFPSMLGAGTQLSPDLDEAEVRQARSGTGGVGEKVGSALKPLFDLLGPVWQKTQDPLLDWPKIWKAVFVVSFVLFGLLAYFAPSATEPPVPIVPKPTRSSFLDFLPFFRSMPSSSYTPPDVPADSLEGLIARLTQLETAVGRISSSSDLDREQHLQDRQALGRLNTQLEVLESTLAAEQERAKVALAAAEKTSAKDAAEVGKSVQAVKGDLDALVSRVKSLSQNRDADISELKRLQGGIDGVQRDMVALDAQISKVAKDLEAVTNHDRIIQIALEAIGKKLPGKMAARIDDSGRLEIDPSFWRVLKDAFAEKKTVDARLAALQPPKGGLFGSPKDTKPSPPVPAAPPSWDDFLSANEDQLKAWVATDLSSRTGSDALITKQHFLDLLRRELKTLKRDFEDKANENFESMGREILDKVSKQEELKRKDALRHQQPPPSSATGSIELKSSDGQNVTAIISSLVDTALIRYSKDVLARPDYALYTAGGRVIRSLTSPTYEPHPLSAARSVLAWVTGTSAPRGRPPVTALHPDTSPGSCWPFAGQHGQIGIQLSRRVVPSDISIEHISREVALDGDVSSAPRDFEVWGIVEGEEDVFKLAQYRQQQLEAKRAARENGGATSLEDDLNNGLIGSEPASLPPSANHILLAAGAYDPSAPSPIQSFPVTGAARHLGIPVDVVVVKVLSNHGESAYTCLYRVRVSGTTEAQVAGTSSSARA